MKRSSQAITIRDVAQLAGVSPATVSKVFNETSYVSVETKERVLAAIDKLNFRPNTIARSLKKQRTLTIGLVTDDLEGVFTMSMMRGVEQVASAEGFSVFLCNSYGDVQREKEHLDVLLAKQVEEIILLSGYRVRERGAPAFRLGSLPVVYLYQYTHDTNAPCVIPDDLGGGYLGTRHLLNQGRRRIGFINGQPIMRRPMRVTRATFRRLRKPEFLLTQRWCVSANGTNKVVINSTRELMHLPNRPMQFSAPVTA